jgi:hypothetical protein
MVVGGKVPAASDNEGGIDDSFDGGGSDIENSRTYNFLASTITLGCIKEMVDKEYFVDGEARVPRAEAVPEPDDDEAVIYEDFFVAGCRGNAPRVPRAAGYDRKLCT